MWEEREGFRGWDRGWSFAVGKPPSLLCFVSWWRDGRPCPSPQSPAMPYRIVYFLNDTACQECRRLGLNLQFLDEISDDELPRRRTVVVGMPERTGGPPTH